MTSTETWAFVVAGRQSQLERLQAALAQALGGQSQVVLVAGDTGTGKTMLVRKLTAAEVQHLEATPTGSPSWPGVFYLEPEDLDGLEDPLLLHPHYDEPQDHLCFGHGGEVFPRELATGKPSDRGEHSISLYHLWDPALAQARYKAQDRAWIRFKSARNYHEDVWGLDPQTALDRARADIRAFIQETTEYRAGALDYIGLRCKLGQ